METGHPALIANELHLAERQVAAVAALLAEGATIPFIARYRKEATGSLDEVAVSAIRDRSTAEPFKSRGDLKSFDQHGHLTTKELWRQIPRPLSKTSICLTARSDAPAR
jgi:uncharacterized protein